MYPFNILNVLTIAYSTGKLSPTSLSELPHEQKTINNIIREYHFILFLFRALTPTIHNKNKKYLFNNHSYRITFVRQIRQELPDLIIFFRRILLDPFFYFGYVQ